MSQALKQKLTMIRVISMVLIVTCHIFQYYGFKMAFWLNVGVQLFFILSGFLYGAKDIHDFKSFWTKKIYHIIIPYEIVVVVFFIVFTIFDKMPKVLDILYYISATQAFNTSITPIAHLWFMSYILLFYLLIPFLQKFDISDKKFFLTILISIVFILQFLQFVNVININATYLMLFIGSYYISRRLFKYKKQFNYNKLLIISGAICLFGVPLQLFLETKSTMPDVLYKFFIIYCDYIHAFLGIALFIIFIKFLPAVKSKLIDQISNYSFSVYSGHQIFILGILSRLKYRFGILYVFASIAVASAILYKITEKIGERRLKK